MKIGIIGPSKLEILKEINPEAEEIINEISKLITNHEVYLVPDKNSVSELFGKNYWDNGGKSLFSLVPLEDKEFGYAWVNTNLSENVSCGTWRNQPENLNEKTEVLICLGYSAGGLAEIGYSKWFGWKSKISASSSKNQERNKKPIYIIEELVTGKLPRELEKNLDLRYISYKDLKL